MLPQPTTSTRTGLGEEVIRRNAFWGGKIPPIAIAARMARTQSLRNAERLSVIHHFSGGLENHQQFGFASAHLRERVWHHPGAEHRVAFVGREGFVADFDPKLALPSEQLRNIQ